MDDREFSDRLLEREDILWTGRPISGLLFSGADIFLIPFSLVWGGFAVLWETLVLGLLAQTLLAGQYEAAFSLVLFALFGIPFVLVGLYLIAGRFVLDARVRAGTRYALTNRRVLILRIAPFARFTALSLDQLADASLSEGRAGRGTIHFGPQTASWGRQNTWMPWLDRTPQFFRIENAGSVFQQIQEAAQKRSRL
jgi:hypothetical protein